MKHDLSVEERFWARVKKGEPNECWPWTGSTGAKGYGKLRLPLLNVSILAHRLSYAWSKGGLENIAGKYICHRCDNPNCVNPAHLFSGTAKDNTHDALKKGLWPSKAFRVNGGKPAAPLKWEQVRAIRKLRKQGKTHRQIAERFGMKIEKIMRIANAMSFRSRPVPPPARSWRLKQHLTRETQPAS